MLVFIKSQLIQVIMYERTLKVSHHKGSWKSSHYPYCFMYGTKKYIHFYVYLLFISKMHFSIQSADTLYMYKSHPYIMCTIFIKFFLPELQLFCFQFQLAIPQYVHGESLSHPSIIHHRVLSTISLTLILLEAKV